MDQGVIKWGRADNCHLISKRHLYQDAPLSTGFLELSLIFSGVNALLSGQFIERRSNSTLTGIV
jgi:hypothetical protein